MRSSRRFAAKAALGVSLCLWGGSSSAQQVAETAAESLVRRVWFEGLPLDRAAALGAADGERLAQMLADPGEAAHHANIAMALGACGCGPAFEALSQFESETRGAQAALARAARLSIPQAMGLLASRDARATRWLEAQAESITPGSGDRAARHWCGAVMQGLEQSGSPRTDELLGELEAAAHASGEAGTARRAAQSRARAGAAQ